MFFELLFISICCFFHTLFFILQLVRTNTKHHSIWITTTATAAAAAKCWFWFGCNPSISKSNIWFDSNIWSWANIWQSERRIWNIFQHECECKYVIHIAAKEFVVRKSWIFRKYYDFRELGTKSKSSCSETV